MAFAGEAEELKLKKCSLVSFDSIGWYVAFVILGKAMLGRLLW
jgi:hypothetical protein